MKHNFFEYLLPSVMIVIALSLVRPFGIGVDRAMVMAKEGMLLAGFVVFALWIWRERGDDEREELHRMIAARAAYLVGSGVLVAGIVMESLAGDVDRWLVYALIGMVLAKMAGSVWVRLRR